MNRLLLAALLLASLPLSACAGMGTLGDVLAGLPGDEVSGEVRRVDERRREIEVRTAYGRSERVEYDRDTRVLFREERYPVRALEPGDEVSMRIQRRTRGGLYTDRIRVERSVRDRRGARAPREDRRRAGDRDYGREARFEGRVGRIDRRAGWFQLRDESRGSFLVTLPYRPAPATADRFRGLRSGDFVRLEGRLLERGRVEIRRFR